MCVNKLLIALLEDRLYTVHAEALFVLVGPANLSHGGVLSVCGGDMRIVSDRDGRVMVQERLTDLDEWVTVDKGKLT